MINESCEITHPRRVDDELVINAEHVAAANSHPLVVLFSVIGNFLPDGFTDVLDDDVYQKAQRQARQF